MGNMSDYSDDEKLPKAKGKSRRELPAGAVSILKAWLLSPEHFTHPYPTPQDQQMLMEKTGIDKKQLKNWFTNARRRIWKPMLKKQMESAGGNGPPSQSNTPGLDLSVDAGVSAIEHPVAVKQEMDSNSILHQKTLPSQNTSYPPSASVATATTSSNPFYGNPNLAQFMQNPSSSSLGGGPASQYNPTQQHSQQHQLMQQSNSPSAISKADSHAVLMELFARDQDLVRRAAEAARLKQASKDTQQFQSPANLDASVLASTRSFATMQSLSSWPHFSSVNSLNNLPQVKSITTMSGADLAAQGNSDKNKTLAHVKSTENMGKADSYAFLEVFFDDKNGSDHHHRSKSRGIKRDREEDNDVGLCLDADDSAPPGGGGNTSTTEAHKDTSLSSSSISQHQPANINVSFSTEAGTNIINAPGTMTALKNPIGNASSSMSLMAGTSSVAAGPATSKADTIKTATDELITSLSSSSSKEGNNNTLRRAYDDALAARGLLSVSRSSEKLTDLALPQKMQRTLSQEFLRQAASLSQGFPSYNMSTMQPAPEAITTSNINNNLHSSESISSYKQHQQASGAAAAGMNSPSISSNQYPGQNPNQHKCGGGNSAPLSDPSMMDASVEVPSTTKCALCNQPNVDTQVRPCGHMFHGKCLKPSLQNSFGPPTCPIDNTMMESAVLAVPVDTLSKTK